MEKIFADIDEKWENLSSEHERLEKTFLDILQKYLRGDDLLGYSYLITGVFGRGKTTFLYHILKKSIDMGMLPIYVIAIDLFNYIEAEDYSAVRNAINTVIEKLKNSFKNKDLSFYENFIKAMPENSRKKLLEYYKTNIDKIKHFDKIILLIDELEDAYPKLKMKAGGDPLRTWLEENYLKILALTPTGIYDLGGADESRLIKFPIPAVDIEYLRNKFDLDAGKANILWWLSRGNPRHIIQNLPIIKQLDKLKSLKDIIDTLRNLHPIGKEPTKVPAIQLDSIQKDYTKIKYLVNLKPLKTKEPYAGFKISKDLDEGSLANIFRKVFNLKPEEEEIALLLAYYFKLVSMVLSDDQYNFYLEVGELKAFIELVLDIMLENEQKRESVEKNIVKILQIFNELSTKKDILFAQFISEKPRGLDYSTNLDKKLPIEISKIKDLFPQPSVNPIVNIDPNRIFELYEGKGQPICIRKMNNIMIFFFASLRDLKKYIELKEEFLSHILPEGKSALILLPDDVPENFLEKIESAEITQLIKWLKDCGKINFVRISPHLKLFLLSLPSEDIKIPYNFDEIIDDIKSNKNISFWTARKIEIYKNALDKLIQENNPHPWLFFPENRELAGRKNIWGENQLKEKEVAVAGLALAFYDIRRDKKNLIELRNLFKTQSPRGKLADIKVGGGLPTLADDILPRKDRRGRLTHSSCIEGIKRFWTTEEKEKLKELARLLSLDHFLKLGGNEEDYKRVLEALWRAERDEFDVDDSKLDSLKNRLEEILKKLEKILNTLKEWSRAYKITIIFKDDYEKLLVDDTLNGLEKFYKLQFKSKLGKYIYYLYLKAILEKVEGKISNIYREIDEIKNDIKELKSGMEDLIEEISKDNILIDFLSDKIDITRIKGEILSLLVFDAELELRKFKEEVEETNKVLETIRERFITIKEKIEEFKEELNKLS